MKKLIIASGIGLAALSGFAGTLDRTNWFDSSGLMTATPGHLQMPFDTTAQYWTTYFAPTNNPFTLSQPGNRIRVTWTFTAAGVQSGTTTKPLAFGVLNTPDTSRINTDIAPPDAAYGGYATFLGDYVSDLFGFYDVGGRTDSTTPSVLFAPNYPGYSGWSTVTSSYITGVANSDTTPYTLTMTLTRNASAGLNVSSFVTGNSGVINQGVYTDPAPNTFSFNSVSLYNSGVSSGAFDTTGFKVDLTYGGSVIVRDAWIDGDRTDPAAPVYSEDGNDSDNDGDVESAWFNSPDGGTMVATPGHLTTTITNGATYWTTYFTTPTNPITLANPGDRIKVTWAFTPSNVHGGSTQTPLHLALLNTQSTNRLTADGPLGDAAYAGYATFMAMGNDDLFSELALAGIADTNAVGPLFQPGFFNQFTGWNALAAYYNYGDVVNGIFQFGANDLPYTFEMTLTRNAAAGLDLESTVTGDSGKVSQLSATDPAPNTYAFDTVTIYGDGSVSGTYDTTLFQVDFFPVPAVQSVTQSNGLMQFVWNTKSNLTYQVQYTPDLSQTNWLGLGSPLTATGTVMNVSDPVGTNGQKFYRVVLLP